jgi:hypothetical protein
MQHLTFERVTSEDVLKKEWYPLFKKIFTDPGDRESLSELKARLANPDLNVFHLMRDNGKPVGIELINLNPSEVPGAMYVPYAGMSEDYRNKGFYPKAAKVSDAQMQAVGAKWSLYDFEDPFRPENLCKGYPDEKPDDVVGRAAGRINFWRRALKCYIVHDPEMPYVRPASDDPKKIQAYDVLSFRALDCSDPKWKNVFNADKTAISKQAYRDFYLEITRLQYGNLPEEKLKAQFPAVQQFLDTVDNNPKQWVSLVTSMVRPNLHVLPAAAVELTQPRLAPVAKTPAARRKAAPHKAKTHG